MKYNDFVELKTMSLEGRLVILRLNACTSMKFTQDLKPCQCEHIHPLLFSMKGESVVQQSGQFTPRQFLFVLTWWYLAYNQISVFHIVSTFNFRIGRCVLPLACAMNVSPPGIGSLSISRNKGKERRLYTDGFFIIRVVDLESGMSIRPSISL